MKTLLPTCLIESDTTDSVVPGSGGRRGGQGHGSEAGLSGTVGIFKRFREEGLEVS